MDLTAKETIHGNQTRQFSLLEERKLFPRARNTSSITTWEMGEGRPWYLAIRCISETRKG